MRAVVVSMGEFSISTLSRLEQSAASDDRSHPERGRKAAAIPLGKNEEVMFLHRQWPSYDWQGRVLGFARHSLDWGRCRTNR